MKRFIICAAALAAVLGSATGVQAQSRSNDMCRPGENRCVTRPSAQQQAGHARPVQRTERRAAPRPGDSARTGRAFQRAPQSRFHPPQRGQDYRIVNEHLVLVDSRSGRIVSVIGLLNALLP